MTDRLTDAIVYYVQGKELHHNISAGIILSDVSLVLQSVSKDTAGDYTCLAANIEGKGVSNPVTLKVMCKFCNSHHVDSHSIISPLMFFGGSENL